MKQRNKNLKEKRRKGWNKDQNWSAYGMRCILHGRRKRSDQHDLCRYHSSSLSCLAKWQFQGQKWKLPEQHPPKRRSLEPSERVLPRCRLTPSRSLGSSPRWTEERCVKRKCNKRTHFLIELRGDVSEKHGTKENTLRGIFFSGTCSMVATTVAASLSLDLLDQTEPRHWWGITRLNSSYNAKFSQSLIIIQCQVVRVW